MTCHSATTAKHSIAHPLHSTTSSQHSTVLCSTTTAQCNSMVQHSTKPQHNYSTEHNHNIAQHNHIIHSNEQPQHSIAQLQQYCHCMATIIRPSKISFITSWEHSFLKWELWSWEWRWVLLSVCSPALRGNVLQCPYHPETPLVEDYHAGDMVCPDCGMVIGDR